MSRTTPRTPLTRWDHWYRRALPTYWLVLFCGTHLPRLELPGEVLANDKVAHLVGFGLLALLFWKFVESLRRPLAPGFVVAAFVLLAAYAAVDELLQGLVNRTVDLTDWLCNIAGIALVLAPLEIQRWLRQRRA